MVCPEMSYLYDFLIWHSMSHESCQGPLHLPIMPPQINVSKEIIDDEEVLQAVVLADSFNKRFRPLTSRKPRVRFFIYLSMTCSDNH